MKREKLMLEIIMRWLMRYLSERRDRVGRVCVCASVVDGAGNVIPGDDDRRAVYYT